MDLLTFRRSLVHRRLLWVVFVPVCMFMLLPLPRLSPYCKGHHNRSFLSVSKGDPPENLWEQQNLLDIQCFEFVMNNERRCHHDSNRSQVQTKILVVLVNSDRSNFYRRHDIRRSWGLAPVYKKFDMRLVFLLGTGGHGVIAPEKDLPAKENKKLAKEQAMNGDLVMGNFVDSFGNLTYKHMMGYKWILNFCQRAALVLKVDDDQFIDIFRWINWRTEDLKNHPGNAPDLYCATSRKGPSRGEGSESDVTCEDWPWDTYPTFCKGSAYGISVDLIRELYSMTPRARFLKIDDVYATGVLLEEVKKSGWRTKIEDISSWIISKPDACQAGSGEMNIEAAAIRLETGRMKNRIMCLWGQLVNNTNLVSEKPSGIQATSVNSNDIYS